MDLAVMCLMFVVGIGLVILIGGLAYELLFGCTRFSEPRPKSQGGKYFITYSYSKKVRGGNSVSGFGNYITEVDITDAESLNKVTDEINKAFYDGKAVVVIMNVLVM